MKRRGSALGKCKGQFHRADYLYSLPMFELPCTSLHKELLCWCYTRLFIGACVAGCTWGLASSLPFTFPCELSIHCPAKEGGVGSVWTDFLSPIKSGLLLEGEDLIFPKMQSAAFRASQF